VQSVLQGAATLAQKGGSLLGGHGAGGRARRNGAGGDTRPGAAAGEDDTLPLPDRAEVAASGGGASAGARGARSRADAGRRQGGPGARRRKGNVGLTSADTACGNYSGGSRRKLALAVALVGVHTLHE